MNENLGAKIDGVISIRSLTMLKYLFMLRKISYILMFFNLVMSVGSSRVLSNTSAT